jgi:predicted signal transduction protein with EAL and GGDEF domain
MYRAKRMGTGHVVYDDDRDQDEYLLLDLAAELRTAIELEQLSLVYQPKVDLRSGRVAGVEALVRWEHAVRGPLSPEHFVPLAERTGSIRALSQLVLRTALSESRRWWEGRASASAWPSTSPRTISMTLSCRVRSRQRCGWPGRTRRGSTSRSRRAR